MRSTLFFISHEIAGIPLFGVGLLLGCLAIALIAWIVYSWMNKRTLSEISSALPVWGIAAAIIVLVLPAVEQAWPNGTPIGLPIRGYGVMVLLGLLCGIGLSVHRGRQLGIEPDTIIGLGFWMMLLGIVGARAFYVVQKWSDEFARSSFVETVVSIVQLTEGGLVIYGGVVGGIIGGAIFCWRHKLKVTATADLVAPGFLIGLSLGRIGCLLHGCCFGGICDANLPTIRFPHGSPPYQAQLASGRVLGLESRSAQQPNGKQFPSEIKSVVDESPAALREIKPGQQLESIDLLLGKQLSGSDPIAPIPLHAQVKIDGQYYAFPPEELPERSLPMHPSQIYAALNALLLCTLIWFLYPFPARDGITFCVAIILYAVSRFLLEGIRSDEAGQLGTSLTVAQWVAIASACGAAIGLFAISRRPAGRVWSRRFR